MAKQRNEGRCIEVGSAGEVWNTLKNDVQHLIHTGSNLSLYSYSVLFWISVLMSSFIFKGSCSDYYDLFTCASFML